ncbi:hypothetical protein [Amycolatopsis regifaucium]|uniref:Lipoprotein n=1 Tax=Amycolatopsis regifaucium TaxID=546365 RepID=A0A154MSX7_9PSEU|nr:hypothetical protein [Amycolatopsis regifaucium]KZB87396.1 hypothetical protein AVL48_22385 [Amycolatopsis regifaucium]OKA08230.1 hypothetical protein ATP06_0213145 [Amycolatopsis regifaucium]SFI44522.1 hypothetical protein SAMN04489731_110294 [Amycolatopsis regifaucium]
MKLLIAAFALLSVGCTTTTPAPSPEEAFRFGGISMPASGKVLETKSDRGIDMRYQVVLTLPAEDVPELLRASNFAPGVQEDDRLVNGRHVYRKVKVDGTTVHLELFTT